MENFTDIDLNCILTGWNLSHLYDRLKEQGIPVDLLKMLKIYHIEKLLVNFPIGDQVKFEYYLEKWINNSEQIPGETYVLQHGSDFNKKPQISVIEIHNTYNGKAILNFYRNNKVLYEEQRNLLINTIKKFIEANGLECSLSDCAAMEKEICSIFPSEELELYTNGRRGKIYNKISHLKRLSKDIPKNEEVSYAESILEDSEEQVKLCLKHLKSESIAAEEFDLYWRKCATFRFKQISESTCTAEIFILWPDYIKPSGFHFINIDFC